MRSYCFVAAERWQPSPPEGSDLPGKGWEVTQWGAVGCPSAEPWAVPVQVFPLAPSGHPRLRWEQPCLEPGARLHDLGRSLTTPFPPGTPAVQGTLSPGRVCP